MKKFYADYAVYEGVAYRALSYTDRIDLFDVDDEERECVLFSVPKEKIEERYSVFNHAVLNGLEYVYYDIKGEQVTFSSTYKDKKILQRYIKDFDLVFQTINRGSDKPMEKKLIYSKDKSISDGSQIKRFYPQEMANGSVMFSVSSDLVSREALYKSIQTLYAGRISDKSSSAGLATDEYIEFIRIDGIVFNISEDLIYGIVTISPAHKGNGEKYIFEIVDCLNKTEQI